MPRMARRLRISVATAQGVLPVMVAASVAPTEGCAALVDDGDHAVGGAGGSTQGGGLSGAGGSAPAGAGGATHVSSAGTGGSSGVGGAVGFAGSFGSAGSTAGTGVAGVGGDPFIPEPTDPMQCFFEVELPPEGVPAQPGQICAAKVVPVESNRAAAVQLARGATLQDVVGRVLLAAQLDGTVVGLPMIEVLDASHPSLLMFTVESVSPDPAGFAFRGRFADGVMLSVDGLTRVTVRVSLQVMCPDAPQLVHSVTDVHLCGTEQRDAEWVSSGSLCSVCRVIAEMAPSPIVPEGLSDGLPLSHVLRLRIVELARVSGSVVLLAEHDGGEGLDYDWRVTEGEVKRLSADVIAWTLPITAAAPLVQVAAFGEHGAAVSSWAFNDEVS